MPDNLPHDGLVAIVKRDCPTCELTAPVLGDLARRGGLTVYTQDDPSFPETVAARVDDTALDVSHRLQIGPPVRQEVDRHTGPVDAFDHDQQIGGFRKYLIVGQICQGSCKDFTALREVPR